MAGLIANLKPSFTEYKILNYNSSELGLLSDFGEKFPSNFGVMISTMKFIFLYNINHFYNLKCLFYNDFDFISISNFVFVKCKEIGKTLKT